MRVLVFHGYLLRGTGSNVYNASLAAALVRLGHEVHLLCQERRPAELPFVDAVGRWERGELVVEVLREPVRCTVYRPDIGSLLPVYVADRYEGIEARPFPQLSEAEVERYLAANVRAVAEVAARAAPEAALANHLVMGPVILARALDRRVPYAVKIHGSALEYTVKPHPRFLPHAREGLDNARGVLVGSRHTAESLWATIGDPLLPTRTRLAPPGVDVEAFAPREPQEAVAGIARLVARLRAAAEGEGRGAAGPSSFATDPAAAADAIEALDPARERLVAFVGKLILAKGVDLLLAAWPLVLARVPTARLVVVGFGAWRAGAERMIAALSAGDLGAVRAIAAQGRTAEGGERGELRHITAFLDGLGERECAAYCAAAARMAERVTLTGRLEHGELADLLPACEVKVVPSTFPEAFGMVAAEAAACGVFPVSADHSGLAEVTAALGGDLPAQARGWLSFPLGPDAVPQLADRVVAWLEAPEELRSAARRSLVAAARERYSWTGVARDVLAAAQGRLDELPPVV